jgi:DNA invertase Pin-like site-specific DNA recombinase
LRAAIYRRISSDDEHDRLGVERQTPPCMKLAEAKGADVVRVFTDNDISASGKKHRPDYLAMLQWVRDGKLDLLIAYSASRFTRDPQESLDLLKLADSHGIQFATVTGDYDLATAEGRYRWRDAANRAAQEREEIAERVRLKHAELREAGKFHGGQRGFGHRHSPIIVDNRIRWRVELDPAEADLIRAAARRVLGGGSLSAIIREWNTADPPVRRPRGRLWDTPRLRELLTSPRIAGLRENGDELVDADWPAIVSRDVWYQLRLILAERPTRKGPREPRDYLGSNIYLCDRCGHPMIGQARMRVPAYACRRERGGCGRLHRMAKPLDDYLRDEVLDKLASPAFRAKLEAAYGATDDDLAAELVARRDGALARLKQLRDLAGDPTVEFDADDFAAAKRSLTGVIEEATAKLADLPAANSLAGLPDTAELLAALWERAPLDRRRALVRLVVDVVIVKAPGGGRRFQPDAYPAGPERDRHIGEHLDIVWRV